MKDLVHTFSKKVSLALSRAIHELIRKDKLNYFKFPLIGFQKFVLFWVVEMILEALDVELESVLSFVFHFCFLAVCVCLLFSKKEKAFIIQTCDLNIGHIEDQKRS